MSTITLTLTHGVTIAPSGTYSYPSPLTIAAGATVSSAAGAAVYGANGGSLVNQGAVRGSGTTGIGIDLKAGGYVDNSSGTALIEGYKYGVLIAGSAGSVTNAGTIEATGREGDSPFTLGAGIFLTAGGYVDNMGLIEATNTAAGNGVEVAGGRGTLVNSGTIISQYNDDWGIYFAAGGFVTNNGSGYILGGVDIAHGLGTLLNSGTIADPGYQGIGLQEGGEVVIQSGTVSGGTAIFMGGAGSVTIDAAGTVAALASNAIGIDLAAGGTIVNLGSIIGGTAGVSLSAGGYVDNSGGLIEGIGFAIEASGTLVTIVNDSGTITSENADTYGIELAAGGYVTNSGTGFIYGGISVTGTSAGIVNFGTISDPSFNGILLKDGGDIVVDSGTVSGATAIYMGGAGRVTNAGTVAGTGVAIDLAAGGTVIDSGAIDGPTAVTFGGIGSNLLKLESGYSISGSIIGSGSIGAGNTLELSSSLGAVTVGYNNLGLVDFQAVDFAAPAGGSDETLVIGNTAALPGTIEGFTAFHDIIDLTNFTYHSGATVTEGANDKLTIVSGSDTLSLQLAGSYGAVQWFATSDGSGGTDVAPACFARGTRILTDEGERAVETLQIGDRVVTHAGRARPVKWIGRRGYKGAFLLKNSELWPVRVAAGALGPGTPRRELYLSAHHALYLDGLLIPVECLVNGSSIVRCQCPEEVEYFHIELGTHDVIIAEGAPAETFIDCDSRQIFQNAQEFALLYPGEEPTRWQFCAPRIAAGRALEAVRRRILARAGGRRVAA